MITNEMIRCTSNPNSFQYVLEHPVEEPVEASDVTNERGWRAPRYVFADQTAYEIVLVPEGDLVECERMTFAEHKR